MVAIGEGITQATSPVQVRRVPYFPRGAQRDVMLCRASEAVMDGPAGTGKTLAGLWKMHLAAVKYPGMHGLLLRKTLVSLKSSTLVTFRERVLGAGSPVRYWTARGDEAAHYAYPNGSKVYVGGLDNPGKIMSTEYDLVFVDEATDLEAGDWEAITTRLRYGVMPYQQLYGAVNPQAPTHWLNQRMEQGAALRLPSHHEDNPRLWDGAEWTAEGTRYMAVLDALTGVRHMRLRQGVWAAAEGTVYQDAWLPERHLLPRRTHSRKPESLWGDCGLDPAWPRYLGIDWGYRNPAVVQWYARRPDGELLLYREFYKTMTLVEDLAREALSLMGWRLSEQGALLPTRQEADPLPREIIADHDAEDRATWERHFGLAVYPAHKGPSSINDGIQAVTKRLADGRLHVLEGSLVQRDPLLDAAKRPCSTAEEFESYVWDTRAGRQPREQPIDEHNHGLDALRYVVTYFDRGEPESGRSIPFHAIGW